MPERGSSRLQAFKPLFSNEWPEEPRQEGLPGSICLICGSLDLCRHSVQLLPVGGPGPRENLLAEVTADLLDTLLESVNFVAKLYYVLKGCIQGV
jgi:hypothetical protein